MNHLDRSQWATLLDRAGEDPSFGAVVAAVEDADMVEADAEDLVATAIDAGELAEDDDVGMFGAVRLPESGETPKPDDLSGEEPDLPRPNPGGNTVETTTQNTVEREEAVAALRDVLKFYNNRLDDEIADHTDTGEHPERPTTARDYFTEVRGWEAATVDELLLGWAPAEHVDQLVAYLFERGHRREAMIATGALGEKESGGLYSTFSARYVLPYFDANGEPAYAIARCTGGEGGGGKGYDGHPADFKAGKYAKLRHTDERVPFEEPIYGLNTLTAGDHVVIAEGIADAITAREAGYAVLSPVAKEFKEGHYDPLAEALDEHQVERVTIVADADSIQNASGDEAEPESIREAVDLSLSPVAAGLGGALRTASKLGERTEADVRVSVPPAPGNTTNDLDEFVTEEWNGDLNALLRSAKPAEAYVEYEAATATARASVEEERNTEPAELSGGDTSALWELDLGDIASIEDGERTKNPFSHTGDSENYFVARRQSGGDIIAKDYKASGGGRTYNALTGLLVDAGKRRRDDPEGSLSDAEVFYAWKQAKDRNDLADDDPVPYRAILGIAVEDGLVDRDDLVEREADTGKIADDDAEDTYRALPPGTYNDALDHIREEHGVNPGREAASREDTDESDDSEEYRRDPRELAATVDMRRAWEAAGRVTPGDLDTALGLEPSDDGDGWLAPNGDRVGDVARAVALDSGLIDTADDDLDDYPIAYNRAREEYGAPLPRYYTTSEAIAEFDAVLDVIGEVTFWDLDRDALNSEITAEGDAVGGEAVRALDPAWRDSESGESVIVFESGTVWDADTERVLDALRFVALDAGIIDDPGDPLANSKFTDAYTRARSEYGAPLPRWEPAEDGAREITPQLPPSEELVAAFDFDGVDNDELDVARDEVEQLIADRLDSGERPTVVTSLPATGKTTGTIKNARERPLSYLAPRKELQQQALDKAENWGVDAEVLPVFSDERVRAEVLDAAVSHVRESGKDRLRDRWAILGAAFDAIADSDAVDEDDLDPSDIFEEEEDDDAVDLDRPTCETADGAHGVAWALVVHIARRLGYTPREIHTEARGLFGAELPCTDGEGVECEYTEGWERVRDADNNPDLLVGSYVHSHIESVRTAYNRGARGEVKRSTRGLVLDEFVGDAFVREFGSEAFDFATWLASSLRDEVEDRRDLYEADLSGDSWVRAWLDGEADEVVDAAVGALSRTKDLLDARRGAAEILSEVDRGVLESLRLGDVLDTVTDTDTDAAAAFGELAAAIDAVDPNQPAAGIASWADGAVREPLARATVEGRGEPDLDAVKSDTLPSEGDLADLLDRAVEAVENTEDGALATLEAARDALRGGSEGCRRLAAWADDGYAHPDAHHLLTAIVTPTDDDSRGKRIRTSNWAFDPDATDGTVLDVVETTDRARVVADRNDHGALLHTPPSRVNGAGEESPLVGLDATGRAKLWSTALGEEVETADIHTTPEERARFLENALSLRVIRAANTPRPYEGDPTTKDTDGDVALLETIAEEYSGIQAPRRRDEEAVEIGRPAAITTKGVREVLENDRRLDGVVDAWENYGNHTGANDLGKHRLAAVLGSQHYGDDAIERFCALAGEEVDTDRTGGRGAALDYGNDLANTYLKHMSEDQTMQAILRFARGDSGATVVARTSALRSDLPVVGEGQVVETWNDTATAIAREYRRLGGEFTAADVRDAVDVSPRQVRRVLSELVRAGYLRRDRRGEGRANVYEPTASTPGAGEVALPQREAVEADSEPGQSAHNQYYTWNVRVFGGATLGEREGTADTPVMLGAPPSPRLAEASNPPE